MLTALLHVHLAGPPLPYWSAPQPNHSAPLAGFPRLKNVANVGAYFGSPEGGWYNHAAMMTYHDKTLTLSWKNAPVSEDTPGQRVLYAQSTDGLSWSEARVLFPNMSSDATPSAQFAGPFAVLGGRLYASASPAVIADGDAQGAQFCLWPDGSFGTCRPRGCQPLDPLRLDEGQPLVQPTHRERRESQAARS